MVLNIESFEETTRGSFFKFSDNDGKHVFITYHRYDPEHDTKKYGKKPAVNVDLVVLESSGAFTEYNDQWIVGAAALAFFIGSKNGKLQPKDYGWQGVQKIKHLPPKDGNEKGSWAFTMPSRDGYDALVAYVTEREEKVEELARSNDLPWA